MQNTKEMFNPEDMYHMFDLKRLNDNIWYYKNVLSYPNELCSFIKDVDKDDRSFSKISPWTVWTASNDKEFTFGFNKEINSEFSINTGNERLDQKIKYIENSFIMAFEFSLSNYLASHGLDKDLYELRLDLMPIRKWTPGSYMGPHCDTYDGNMDLAFSMILYLNDDYEGGEISFPNHGVSMKPDAGSLVIFPSQEPYLHQVHHITSGERYTCHLSVYKK